MPDTITRFGGTLAPFADAHARLARLLTTFFDVHLRGGDPARLTALDALEGLKLLPLRAGPASAR
jgi:hypothetical protein